MANPPVQETDGNSGEGLLPQLGIRISDWTERWFPDPFVFALLGILTIFLIGMALGESPLNLAVQGGRGFWSLSTFTLQMVMVVVGGYVVASTPVARRIVHAVASWPKTPRGALALLALFSTLTALISWGLSLVFSGLLARAMAQRINRLDYRAAGAAAYLGLGAVWAMGLSSSAALMMATKSAIPASLLGVTGILPLTQTIFLWPSLITTALLIVTSVTVAYVSCPSEADARPASYYGIVLTEQPNREVKKPNRAGGWLEDSPILPGIVALVLLCYLFDLFKTSPQGALAALDLNTYNLIFIVAGLLLHGSPRRFLQAVADSIPATAGVVIQFPFYGVIFGMITGTAISGKLANLFSSISTHDTFGLLVATYSSVLGFFVPSGGSKWVLEAPYVMEAAIRHQVHLGWVVQIYNASEALPNLINPFWMLPLLGILKVRARDLIGFCTLQLIVHIPLVFFLCWIFSVWLPFIPPTK